MPALSPFSCTSLRLRSSVIRDAHMCEYEQACRWRLPACAWRRAAVGGVRGAPSWLHMSSMRMPGRMTDCICLRTCRVRVRVRVTTGRERVRVRVAAGCTYASMCLRTCRWHSAAVRTWLGVGVGVRVRVSYRVRVRVSEP